MENILVADLTLHSMNSRLEGKYGFMAIKHDKSKNYDRVEWNFLYAMMTKLGFQRKWIDTIMKSICSVKYLMLINGQPQESVSPSRGIRQDDLLSPYLFILCVEDLSFMLPQAGKRGIITGVPTGRNGLRINQLSFKDGSLLFCKTNSLEWSR